jgi:hypothetical protein
MALLYPLHTFSLDTSTPQFSSTPVKLRPFLVQGATTGIPPGNPERTSVFYKKNKDTPLYSTEPTDYDVSHINTKNIIYSDYCAGTTLVDMVDSASPRYEFAFAAIHTNDLNTTSEKNTVANVVSMLFTHNKDVYHIQIPLVVSSSIQPSDVNPLLRSWLDPSTPSKESFSMNQLFHVKQSVTVDFDRYTFTMNYNQSTTDSLVKITGITKFAGKYTLCLFKTPQYVLNYASLAKNDLPTFNDVFNYVMKDTFTIASPRYPLQSSPDIYMLANSSSKYPMPTFYSIPTRELSQLRLEDKTEGFANSCSNGTAGRLLNSVKCYPIDLATQVDANGDIRVDETTAMPIDVKQMEETGMATPIPVQTSSFNYKFMLIIIILFSVALLLMIGVVVYTFRSTRSVVSGAVAAAPAVAPVAAAPAVAVAPVAAVAAVAAAAAPPPNNPYRGTVRFAQEGGARYFKGRGNA